MKIVNKRNPCSVGFLHPVTCPGFVPHALRLCVQAVAFGAVCEASKFPWFCFASE